ncbi:MAG: (S)-ureidoglycine aminohydrolase [Limimaricola sp.]|uniref:bifunctional allantoicase/(S)-ureidoglycine aminohydrolase n=1 Tax=Limimaricola sp. TaxID=2211665 RepID=UPI001DD0EC44|nr:bifunctional allantoicase/(S)-ureidoglycine aminohydrolase [Limimaricola sp.]MBI1417529.1 (S)-ureidoglycine aminohydrolase [Limimaricola sp.]
MTTYAFPPGGLPDLAEDPVANGAIFTTAYALIPAGTMRDITASLLPGWTGTRAWIIARPLSGFAETFAQYAVEVAPGGGSTTPEPDPGAQAGLFVAEGQMTLTAAGSTQVRGPGSYTYLPPGQPWSLRNAGPAPLRFHWVRKRYVAAPGLPPPDPIFAEEADTPMNYMPGTRDWATQRFADPADLRHDMHVNIVTFQPGGRIPFAETHVMEHGLYVLTGTAEYLLNDRWHSVGPGDFMWLRAFCPQACIATGDGPFRYLLYKDVNRHASLTF